VVSGNLPLEKLLYCFYFHVSLSSGCLQPQQREKEDSGMIMRMQDYKRKKKGCQIHLSASNGLIIPFGYDSSRSQWHTTVFRNITIPAA
jgi:hypothetical protein